MIVGNTLVFRDDNHVTTEYAQLLTPVVGALADRAVMADDGDRAVMNFSPQTNVISMKGVWRF